VDWARGDGRGDRTEIAWYQWFSGFWDNSVKCTLENGQQGFSKPFILDRRIFKTPKLGQVDF